MTNDKKLANELLTHNGLKPEVISSQTHKQIQEMLVKESKRASRFRRTSRILWLTLVIWLAVVAILSNVFDRTKFPGLELAIMGFYVIVLAAIIYSIMAHVASRNATLKQIQASLADIAEELKRQSKDS